MVRVLVLLGLPDCYCPAGAQGLAICKQLAAAAAQRANAMPTNPRQKYSLATLAIIYPYVPPTAEISAVDIAADPTLGLLRWIGVAGSVGIRATVAK
ncbi:hypothetical protein THAOC_37878 [Thalassiosira oceanica]|uniref:Secreted protein n=1 Tax=Thalassiosira oceanica TaxID=159749 RepID=K0RB08_THAOC|nr:hypothetical protein THAOC_37878 [Thalassiosira oceanica]|eukprot:EJK43657.1 hypothetical protein THAOC_37878 [Thalassiosira oceanica]